MKSLSKLLSVNYTAHKQVPHKQEKKGHTEVISLPRQTFSSKFYSTILLILFPDDFLSQVCLKLYKYINTIE